MRLPKAVTAVLLVCAAFAAQAAAQAVPGETQGAEPKIFSQTGAPDLGGAHIPIYAECVAAPIGASECTVRLVLEVEGEVVFDAVRTIPVNEDGIVEPVLVRSIRDRVMRSGRNKLAAHLQVFATDGTLVDETRRTDRLGPFKPRATFMDCGVPLYSPAEGGTVTATWGDEHEVLTGDVPAYLGIVVGRAPVTMHAGGLSYALSPKSRFSFSCSSTPSVRRGRPFPTLILESGTVDVSGRPSGARQPAAAVVVQEAGFTSSPSRRVSFTVTRNARRHIDTVHVTRGRVTARHLFFSGLTFPCTTGKTIRVGPRGLLH